MMKRKLVFVAMASFFFVFLFGCGVRNNVRIEMITNLEQTFKGPGATLEYMIYNNDKYIKSLSRYVNLPEINTTVSINGCVEDSCVYETFTVKRLETPQESAAYKEACKKIPYKNLTKDISSYVGDGVYYKGKILQAQRVNGMDFIRLAINYRGYGVWDDVIGVLVDKTNFVQDDVIEVRGELTDTYCYTSQAGWEICIPLVKAKYIK